LDEGCPTCGRAYGFPLCSPPAEIGPYRILQPLGRGFYAATYVAERKTGLRTKVVLKVTPKSFYEFFRKNFEDECRLHQEVAEGTEHLVKIRDMLSEVNVTFGTEALSCCVAQLDYVEGPLLTKYFEGKEKVTAQVAAQIAIDLLRLREELERRHIFHNDLHAGNIIVEKLKRERQRADAIEPSIRAVAIDLGSAAEISRSDPEKQRVGDLTRIADHMSKLVGSLLRDPDSVSDHDFRLTSAVQSIFHVLAAPAENTRLPAAQELIDQIRYANAMLPRHNWRSWRQPLALGSFGSYYNALTLEPWHVPALLIDPKGTWLGEISTPGPQVITGMRGCGKTMLLRALQFHARASKVRGENDAAVIARIKNDRYVGLFVSAQRLLDKANGTEEPKSDPFARLLLAYALEAVRSIMHLKDIEGHQVADSAHKVVAAALQRLVSGLGDLTESIDLDDLDFRISRALVQHSQDATGIGLQTHAAEAFVDMAESIRSCSEQWAGAQILYLLDDVSTRYLKGGRIKQVLSALLFQNPACAFKITSEVQTMELELKTPGENLPAREGRDYSVFDLGSAVYDEIKGRQGRAFVEEILSHRARHFSAHPQVKPSQILGDVNLETIAREIAKSSSTSSKRKEVYRGITAVAHVCVGDIGDVIKLYERIVKAADGRYPVPADVQSNCFQDHCSHRLYDLNRRGGALKDVARSFAEASYELLVKSLREDKKNGRESPRLRQYSSIYVRMTTGDTGKQMNQLRELIDAGVFVFTGGRPRTKTKDSDPILQFKLTFRRIYGLTNFIGLAERDRFELSGAGLEEWLADPSRGKEILLRNLGGGVEEEGVEVTEEAGGGSSAEPTSGDAAPAAEAAPTLFDLLETRQEPAIGPELPHTDPPPEHEIRVEELTEKEVAALRPTSVVLGLGFEDRTLESTRELVRVLPPATVFAIRYEEEGKSKEMRQLLYKWGSGDVRLVPYDKAIREGIPTSGGSTLVDVTGLAKPVIFHSVRRSLLHSGSVLIAHTRAKQYYPTEADMKSLLKAERNRQKFFEALADILTGEQGPYRNVPLLDADADETRRNVLVAFASPKHERLLSLIDSRVIDRLEVIAPDGKTARNRVARQIAEIAATDNASAGVTLIDSDDLTKTIDFLLRSFSHWYVRGGFNFEVGLTGSKMEAVAAAAVSAVCKLTQCWYVGPRKFDPQRFTKGAGGTRFFRIAGRPNSLPTAQSENAAPARTRKAKRSS
jgi:hypothetical protein